MVEIARELELQVEPADVILSQFHTKTLMDEEELHIDEQKKWLLEAEYTCSKDSVKTIEMTTDDLGCYINSAGKTTAGVERLTTILRECLP